MQKRIILIVISIELSIIFFLGYNIYTKFFATPISITSLHKTDHVLIPTKDLKFFFELKPNSKRNNSFSWLPEKTINTINNDGLHERFNYSIEHPKNTFRIVMLGDSWVFGLYLNTKDNFPEQLEDLLTNKIICDSEKKFEVLNLGVPGYDLAYSVEHFKIRGKKYNPDLVIWLIKNDDFYQPNELIEEKSNKYKKEMMENGELEKEQKNGNFFPYVIKAQNELLKEYGKPKIIELQKKQLQNLDTIYKGPLLLLTFPYEDPKIIDALKTFTKSRNNTYISAGVAEISDPYKLYGGHPTKQGYTLISDYTFHYLKSNNLIPCN